MNLFVWYIDKAVKPVRFGNVKITESVNNAPDNGNIEKIENINITTEEPGESTETAETAGLAGDIAEISPAEKNIGAFEKFKGSVAGITVILGIITVVMALVLALLNSFTAPVITKRIADEKNEAVANLFGAETELEILTGFEDIYLNFAAPVTEVLLVKDISSQNLIGYCVTVIPKGYGGQIMMLVAVNPDISVKSTKILSMSETSGLGTKIESEKWFGKQFEDKKKTEISNANNANNNINAIAGATVSSKAFINGINAALDISEEISRQMSGITGEGAN